MDLDCISRLPGMFWIFILLLLLPGLAPEAKAGHMHHHHLQLNKRDTRSDQHHHHDHSTSSRDELGAGSRKNPDLKLISFTHDYNIHEYPPTESGKPLKVGFQINLRNVLEVNEVSQICSLETTIRMYWVDPR